MIKLVNDSKTLSCDLTKTLTDEVYQGLKEGIHDFVFDINIGYLSLYYDQDEMSFKFTPSEDLVKRLNSKLSKNRELIIKELETKVIENFLSPLKEL